MEKSRNLLPTFLRKRWEELDEKPELNEKIDEITDFIWLIEKIWCISNEEYQKRIWVDHETLEIVDSYDDSTMYFLEDTEAVFGENDGSDPVKMTVKQQEMLRKLYDMIDYYELNDRPSNREDKAIVDDPKWHVIRDYAKLVYKEITGENA